jgi:hypothetical protein
MKENRNFTVNCIHARSGGECSCRPIPSFARQINSINTTPNAENPTPFIACGYIFTGENAPSGTCEARKPRTVVKEVILWDTSQSKKK